MIKNTRFTKKH